MVLQLLYTTLLLTQGTWWCWTALLYSLPWLLVGSWIWADTNASIVFWQPGENDDRPAHWAPAQSLCTALLCCQKPLQSHGSKLSGLQVPIARSDLGHFLSFPTSKTEIVLPCFLEPSETCSRKVWLKCTYDDDGLFITPPGNCSSAWYISLLKSYSWYLLWFCPFPSPTALLIVIFLLLYPYPRGKEKDAFLQVTFYALFLYPIKLSQAQLLSTSSGLETHLVKVLCTPESN